MNKMQNSNKNPNKKKKNAQPKVKKAPKSGGTQMAPIAMNRSSVQTGKNSQRYRECERIGTIVGSSSFANALSLQTNPGLSASFPWLSGHAGLFEKYKVHKLVYRYKNLKGTSTDGNVIMSYDYDTLDAPPSSAILATQSTHYADGAPWRIFELKVPTDGRVLFTRSSVVSGADLKTYDMGQIHISTEGCANTSVHGYIEVEYDIELLDKQPSTLAPSASGNASVFKGIDTVEVVGENVPIPLAQDGNLLNIVISGNNLLLPTGNYLVTLRLLAYLANSTFFINIKINGVLYKTFQPLYLENDEPVRTIGFPSFILPVTTAATVFSMTASQDEGIFDIFGTNGVSLVFLRI